MHIHIHVKKIRMYSLCIGSKFPDTAADSENRAILYSVRLSEFIFLFGVLS